MSRHRRTVPAVALLLTLTLLAPLPAAAAHAAAERPSPSLWERLETLFSPSWWTPFSEHLAALEGASVSGEGAESSDSGADEDPGDPSASATVSGEGSRTGAGVTGEG